MIHSLIKPSSRLCARLFVCVLLWLPALSHAQDDAYLKAIEAETDSLQVDRQGVINAENAPEPSPEIQTTTSAPPTPAAAGGIEAFETRLQAESRSLHRFYRKLNEDQKQIVFQEYQNNNDIKALRPTIVRLYTGR